MKVGKVWGETTPLLQSPLLEVHKVSALEGGYSSKHKHDRKWNAFFVLDGQLIVKRWKEYGLVDETILDTHEFTTVPPGEWHSFEVPFGYSCEFLEWYYLEPLSEDIIREDSGGSKSSQQLDLRKPGDK